MRSLKRNSDRPVFFVRPEGGSAVRAGATREEAAEAIGVTFFMQGGPATIYGARAFAAFCEFADAAEAKVA